VQKNLQREWVHVDIIQSDLRLKGEEHPREIKEAWLEPNGKMSAIKDPTSKPVQKKDFG
jgi:uncharacterized membrane protein YcaP (DUF421 family)